MRGKIIAVFAVVVVVAGVLFYALARAALGDLSVAGEAPRELSAAGAHLQLEGLVLERWLGKQATEEKNREPFNAGTAPARAQAATTQADKIYDAAVGAQELAGIKPALIVLVDKTCTVLGRNGNALMRGDNLCNFYPALKQSLTAGTTGSDVWVNAQRKEQYLASFAGVRGADGSIVGAIAAATPINDERLTEATTKSPGGGLIAAVKNGDALEILAKSTGTPDEVIANLQQSPAKDAVFQALATGQVVDVGGLGKDTAAASHVLEGYGQRKVVLISVAKAQTAQAVASLLWPALGVTLLSLILVVVGAYFLDAYISRPISEIEDGLLAIMNGRTDMRFEIEHAELGGLVFRLNSLLNQLLGVQEDDTDDQGRPSRAPQAAGFSEALEVDETMAPLAAGDVADAHALRQEPDDQYYSRIFNEYIRAKQSLGDPVDHITREAFAARIMASERETSQKHGKPVRYKVEVRGREVVLIAVPLA